MTSQSIKMPLKEIVEIFNQIESKNIISIAKNIQQQLKSDKSLILKGKKNEYKLVTQADIKIQKLLLDYFDNSPLKNSYKVIAEEKIEKKVNKNNTSWKLIIDPLDGTSSFKNQSDTWGVMVGACDNDGVLRYSWNLLSTGEIFTSGYKQTQKPSFQNKILIGKSVAIDVYDYDSSLSNKFKDIFEMNFDVGKDQIIQTSYPAAIWAGYKLYSGKLDGLLWLPSEKGKKFYPGYDLIFLGALLNKGYSIIIGRTNSKNSMIAIATTLDDAQKLYQIGLNLIPTNLRQKMKTFVNELKIIN